jgi:ATP-binding cassette, subfamily C (CFTR/MRP), member 1
MNSTRPQCNVPPLSADAAFGPVVEGCRFDFTFTFEQYFFSIIPSVIFLLLAPIRVNILRKRQTRVGGTYLRAAKLVCVYYRWRVALLTVTGGHWHLRNTTASNLD